LERNTELSPTGRPKTGKQIVIVESLQYFFCKNIKTMGVKQRFIQ
jgi:hypothetical protein